MEFFKRINAFLYNKAAGFMIGLYFLNQCSSILDPVAPAAALLSGIITLKMMSRHNEVMALNPGGRVTAS